MQKIKYVLFDAANTLIHKSALWEKLTAVFENNGFDVPVDRLKYHHKLLSEYIDFPDQTSEAFYQHFNRELLLSLGIKPEVRLLSEIFSACTYLPWKAFDDTEWLKNNKIPTGVLSNFNRSLPNQLTELFGDIFTNIIVSEDLGKRKPDPGFYIHAIDLIGLQPHEILYIGDSFKLDILPALNAGMKPLLIDRLGIYAGNKYTISSIFDVDKHIS
jgi:putative hydrolase of the HAD superfamily